VPAVLCGVVLALWVTRTTLNIESFMGAIMAVGVAVSKTGCRPTRRRSPRPRGVSGRSS
jgi:hypothetical protein